MYPDFITRVPQSQTSVRSFLTSPDSTDRSRSRVLLVSKHSNPSLSYRSIARKYSNTIEFGQIAFPSSTRVSFVRACLALLGFMRESDARACDRVSFVRAC